MLPQRGSGKAGRWYSQPLGVAWDIPRHGPEPQSVAVDCGAAAGTQGRAGTRAGCQQGAEHPGPDAHLQRAKKHPFA